MYTTKGQNAWWWLVVLGACLAPGCEQKPSEEPPDEPPRPVRGPRRSGDASLAELLGVDASELAPESVPDPPAPAGDLRAEVEGFSSIEQCVQSRAAFDPVVGDAVDALGYDTLKHDACRVLQAAKTRSTAPCRDILSSMLRDHCESTVAVVSGDPMLCPVAGGNHDALCVALAKKDERLCHQVASAARVTCEAIIVRDAGRCRRQPRCERMVARWKAFMPEPVDKPLLGTRVKVRLEERVDGGVGTVRELDFSRRLNGATVRKTEQGTVVILGDETTQAWPPAMIATEPRLALRLTATEEVRKQGRHAVPDGAVGLSMLAPKWISLDSTTLRGPVMLEVDLFGTDLTAPVRFKLEAELGPEHRPVRVTLEVNTYVRDVVTVGATRD